MEIWKMGIYQNIGIPSCLHRLHELVHMADNHIPSFSEWGLIWEIPELEMLQEIGHFSSSGIPDH